MCQSWVSSLEQPVRSSPPPRFLSPLHFWTFSKGCWRKAGLIRKESNAVFRGIIGIVWWSTNSQNEAGQHSRPYFKVANCTAMLFYSMTPFSEVNNGGWTQTWQCIVYLKQQYTKDLMRVIKKNSPAILVCVSGQATLHGSSQLAVWLGFISHRYFHVCGLLHIWETTQRKWANSIWRTQTFGRRPRSQFDTVYLTTSCVFEKQSVLSRCVNKL